MRKILFSSLLLGAMLSTFIGNAKVVHTTYAKTLTDLWPNNEDVLDIQGANIKFTFWGWNASGFQLEGTSDGNAFIDKSISSPHPMKSLNMDDEIGPNSTFEVIGVTTYYPKKLSGTVTAGHTTYLGFKAESGGKTYYGWMKITAGAASVTIDEYAYEDEAGVAIKAGSTASSPSTTGISTYSTTNDHIVIYPNPAQEVINFRLLENLKNPHVTVVNVAGETVYMGTPKGSAGQYQIDATGLENGYYWIRVESGNYGSNQTQRYPLVINR